MNWFYLRRAREQADRLLTLRQAGCSGLEIDQLCQWSRAYQPNEQDQPALNPHLAHLRFLRWLVQTGKLTEDVS
jgi:hypothetical protein